MAKFIPMSLFVLLNILKSHVKLTEARYELFDLLVKLKYLSSSALHLPVIGYKLDIFLVDGIT